MNANIKLVDSIVPWSGAYAGEIFRSASFVPASASVVCGGGESGASPRAGKDAEINTPPCVCACVSVYIIVCTHMKHRLNMRMSTRRSMRPIMVCLSTYGLYQCECVRVHKSAYIYSYLWSCVACTIVWSRSNTRTNFLCWSMACVSRLFLLRRALADRLSVRPPSTIYNRSHRSGCNVVVKAKTF